MALSPGIAYEGDTLTCSPGTATDADGDTVVFDYAWVVNGLANGRTSSSLSSSYFGKGDDVFCTVTPTDNLSTGSPVDSNVVTIANTAPEATGVGISPSNPTATDDLTCTWVFFDVDADTDQSTVVWSINGQAAGTGTTLSAGSYVGDDAVTCTVTPFDGTDSGATSSRTTYIGNTAPVLTSAAISPDPAYEGDTLSCVPGTATDLDGDGITYSYDWWVNGASISRSSSSLTSSSFDHGDSVACEVTPTDGSTSGASVISPTIVIENSVPELTGVSISPSLPQAGDSLVCAWSFSDADGDSDLSTLSWTVNGVAAGSGATLSSGFVGGDEVVCTVTPYDGVDSGTPVSASVSAVNSAPTVAGVSLSPTTATEGSTLSCTPSGASDPDGDSVSYAYSWTVDGAGVGVSSSTLGSSYFDKGNVVRCSVIPTDGTSPGLAVSSNSVTIGNSTPSVSSVSLSPSGATEADTLTCTPSGATDADGDSVSYAYSWTVNGSSVSGSSNTISSSAFAKGDSVRCIATPTDGTSSGTAVASNAVTIANSLPSLTSISISPAAPTLGSTLTCSYGYSDADGDADQSTIAWTVGSVAAGTGPTKTGGFGAGDTITCTVTPNDGTASGTPLSTSVSVGNNPPVLSSVSLSPTSATEGSTLTCTPGSASDPEGDPISYSYSWTVDGASPGVSTSSLSSAYFAKNNAVRCTVTPTDGSATGTPVASNTVTISNSAPSLASVTLSPSTAYEGDTLSCTPGTATDADGDSVSYTYAWTVNGTSNGRTSSTLSSTYFSRGDVVRCAATPTDGSTSGTAVQSNSITISNTVPQVANVSISPTSPTAGQALTCSYTYSDADNDSDASTIAWTVNGTAAGTGTTLSSGFRGGQTVTCTVTPRDSSGAGTARSASVTVANSAPVLASVSLTPTTAYEGNTLTCTPGSASDADGDSITYSYSWLVNGASVGVSTSTLSSSYFTKNNSVRCSVTPSDAASAGTAVASNTVSISNSAPVISSVTLSPALAYTNDTLTVAVSSSDADNDAVSYHRLCARLLWDRRGLMGALGS